jgi:hypothetical protein
MLPPASVGWHQHLTTIGDWRGTNDRPCRCLLLARTTLTDGCHLPLRPLHRALRLGAAPRAHVADVIQFPGDWRGASRLHRLFAAGTSDNRQGL